MKRILLLICLLTTTTVNLWANGGGITYYGVNGSGNPYFKNFPEVKILREDLLIRPVGDRINVSVTYLMHNTSDKDIKGLHYAFPVDFWCQRKDTVINNEYREIPINPNKEMAEAIKYVEFICNGEILQSQSETPNQKGNEAGGAGSAGIRSWYFTTIDLPHGVSQLTVNYSLQSEITSESGDFFNIARFMYDFSPAGTFGDGIIKEFAITIDANGLGHNDINFDECEYSFESQGKLYTYTQSNFDLKKPKPLIFTFNHTDNEANILISRIPTSDLIIKTSSATSNYPISNLTDLDFGTAFVFGKNGGIGEWIEITAKNKINISAIYILPGYYKSEETELNNNRIKKVLAQYISCRGEVMDSQEVEFPETPYQKPDFSNFSAMLQFPFGIEYDYFDPIDVNGKSIDNWMPGTVRITILEVYTGLKYNDTCISEMFVVE